MAFEGGVELVRQKYKKNNKKFYFGIEHCCLPIVSYFCSRKLYIN